MKVSLPAHIEFVQSLGVAITDNLSDSCGESLTYGQLLALADSHFNKLPLSYANLRGNELLKNEIVKLHQGELYHLDKTNVLTFAGAQEALQAIYQSILTPNDDVVLCAPSYPSLYQMAVQLSNQVHTIDLSFECKWQYDVNDIAARITDNTKLVVINSPHNPTGACFKPDECEALIALLTKHDVWLLLDEVSAFSNDNHKSSLASLLAYNKTIALSVMSKSFGLAGVRLGWLLCHQQSLLTQLLAQKCYGSICTSAVDEQLAIIALQNKDVILSTNNELIFHNKKLFSQFIAKHSSLFSWHKPKQGILTTVKCHFNEPVEQWCTALAQQTGILLLPTSLFGLEGNYVRLGLGKKSFAKSLERLDNYLS